jgi:hypothetical protein
MWKARTKVRRRHQRRRGRRRKKSNLHLLD